MSADLRDIVAPLLKMAVWYTQLKNEPQAQKVYAEAIRLIENDGPRDPQLVQVLKEYSNDLRGVGKTAEAGQLAAYAQHIVATRTDVFFPDGTERPWYHRPDFIRRIPAFPAEYRSSHTGPSGGCGCWALPLVTLVAGLVLIAVLDTHMPEIMRGGGGEVLLGGVVVFSLFVGCVVYFWDRVAAAREGRGSWFKFTDDGIEFQSPSKHQKYQWKEITYIKNDTEIGTAEDTTWDSFTVYGPRGKFTISARFFTVEEVHLALGILSHKTDQVDRM